MTSPLGQIGRNQPRNLPMPSRGDTRQVEALDGTVRRLVVRVQEFLRRSAGETADVRSRVEVLEEQPMAYGHRDSAITSGLPPTDFTVLNAIDSAPISVSGMTMDVADDTISVPQAGLYEFTMFLSGEATFAAGGTSGTLNFAWHVDGTRAAPTIRANGRDGYRSVSVTVQLLLDMPSTMTFPVTVDMRYRQAGATVTDFRYNAVTLLARRVGLSPSSN